tara:strand:- start:2765 stop:3445 length:681 start_codon:yes stop_codon:yes gene_type:complete
MATLADLLRTGYTPPTGSPMVEPIKQHFASLPQKFNENQAAQMDLLARAYPGNTFKSMMTEGDNKALAELAMQVPIVGMMAYHGTNTKFNKFKDALANTRDEGWLGKGHYFSTDPNVARANKYVANVDLEANKPYELAMPNFSTDKRDLIRSALNLEKTATAKDVTNKLKELGHDSVVLDYSPTGYKNKEILVFGGKQANIKNWADVPKTSFNKMLLEEQTNKVLE